LRLLDSDAKSVSVERRRKTMSVPGVKPYVVPPPVNR
jgi:hypothetical protein